jgi:hypothetical protein
MIVLERVLALLAERAVPHAVISAAALAARGVARSTYAIDLLATDRAVLFPSSLRELRDAGVAVETRTGDLDDPLAGVVRIEAAGERPVDVIVGRHPWQARALTRAEHPPGGPPVVAARDLVLLKLYAGGTQDLWDVRELLQLAGAAELVVQVEEELAGLPGDMRARWARARE